MNLRISRINTLDAEVDRQVVPVLIGEFDWIKSYNIKTIIDIGANEGQFTSKMLSILPNAQIHCFEPLLDVFQKLKLNFAEYDNVTVYNFGLGESNEETEIFNNEFSPSSSLLEMMNLHKDNFDFAVKVETKNVSIRRLNDCFDIKIKRPLLIKIDVQGYEMYVLRGGDRVIEQADIIIIEASIYQLYKDQPLFDNIYSYLIDRGFRYAGNFEQVLSPLDNKILQVDAIFIGKNFIK